MSHLTLAASEMPPDDELFAEVIEQLDVGLCIVDDDGGVRSCNALFRNLLGLPAGWARAQKSKAKKASTAENLVTGWCARVIAHGDFTETVVVSPQVSVALAGRALASGGVALHVRQADDAETLRLRTELGRSETPFHNLLDHVPVSISVKDTEGKFVYVNPAWERSIGKSAADMLGRTIWDAVPEDDWSESDASDARLLGGECEVIEDEIVSAMGDGRRHTFQRIKFPVFDVAEQCVGIGTITNEITALVEQREGLRRSEAALRYGQKLARMGNWDRNFVTGEVYWSDQVFELFGIKGPAVPGLEMVLDAIHPDDRQKFRTKLEEMHAGVAFHDLEFRIVAPDGSVRYVQEWAEADFDSEGRPIRCVGVLQDVTTARLAENALRESEASLANAQRIAHLGNWDWDIANKTLHWSDEIYNIFGLDRDAFGASYDAFLNSVHPDDRSFVVESVNAALTDGADYSIDHRIVRPDGQVRIVHEQGEISFDADGRPVQMIGTVQDVTEQRQAERALRESEEWLRAITDNAPSAIFVKDLEGRHIFANRHWHELFNPSGDDLSGLTVHSILPPELHGQAEKIDRQVLETGESVLNEFKLQNAAGEWRYILQVKFPIRDANGTIIALGGANTDITERVVTERALRESEERLRAIADNAPSAIFLKDVNGRYIFANRMWHEMYNAQGGEIIGKTVADFFPPDIAQAAIDADNQVLTTGEPTAKEQYLPTQAGEKRMVLQTKFPVRDEAGDIIAIGAVNTDITERVAAERALRESEERFRALVDNLPASLSLKDADHKILFVNRQLSQWHDIPAEEFIGKRFGEVFAGKDNSDAEFSAAQDIVLGSGRALEREIPTVFADGETHDLQAIIFPVSSGDGQHINVGTFSFDITDRKAAERARRESEERFRAFVDNLPAGVTLKGPDGNVIFINEWIEKWYGVTLERVEGKKFRDVTARAAENDLGHARLVEAQRTVMETGRAVEVEVPLMFVDGTSHELRTVLFPIETADGQAANIGGIYFDITEIKKTEEMLRQAQKMQAVGQLTGGVAHDFNNLLAVVIGNLELIADHFVAQLQQEAPVFGYVRKAFAAAERGASLTHHLLAFSRQQVLQPEEADLVDLVAETNDLMAVSMGERIAVTLHNVGNPWPCKVDRVQLQNAILNLAINARDAMSGSGEISIAVENVRLESERAATLELPAGDYVCVSIGDTGPGIADDVLEHVYEPFFTTKPVGQGSGLGLSMVYGFVRQSGGGIDIDTAVGEGTTVHMYFPAIVSSAFVAIEEIDDALHPSAPPDATVVLVEDNPMFREVTRAILEGLNYRVHDFGTAEEALELIGSSADLDLLLSDIGLPGNMDGHALAEHAASARPGLKIVLMSAHADRGPSGGIVDHNVSAFLRKPHRKAELDRTLRRLLSLEDH